MENSTPVCGYMHAHEDIVNKVNKRMPKEQALYGLADFYKVFGDVTRLKILYALYDTELCVCDIAALIDMSQSAVSHQLRVLKTSRLVKFRREGKAVFYSLDDEHVKSILHEGLDHLEE